MLWIILIALAFGLARFVKIFPDYGSNFFLVLSVLFLFFSLESFFIWVLGWLFLILSFYGNVDLSVG